MPVPADVAATVARRHRLTLADAAALARLADDEDHAEKLAADFDDLDIAGVADQIRGGRT